MESIGTQKDNSKAEAKDADPVLSKYSNVASESSAGGGKQAGAFGSGSLAAKRTTSGNGPRWCREKDARVFRPRGGGSSSGAGGQGKRGGINVKTG